MGVRGPLKAPKGLSLVPTLPMDEDVAVTAADKVVQRAPNKPANLPRKVSDAWDEIVPTLEAAGMLSPADGPSLELALRHYVQAVLASNELMAADSVLIHDDKNGRDAKHPASQIFRDHSDQFLKYGAQLGLTFAARARINLSDEKKDNDNPFG